MNHTLPSLRGWLLMLCLLCTAAVANAWTVSITKTNIKCNGAANGTATANVSGSPFIVAFANYLWSNGATTKTITGLAPGTYSVTVSSLGSSKIASTTITQPTAINTTVTAVSPCPGQCNGFAYASVSGGTPPYIRQWSNGATTAFVAGLCAGTYWLTITDANGCKKIVGTSLTPMSVAVAATQVTCNTTGSATAVASGTPPFSYAWSTGATTATITGLTAGTYYVTATGISGCTASASVAVTAAPVPFITLSVTQVQCNNPCSGAINTTVATIGGGSGPYTVQWNDGATTMSRAGLCPGTYSITITDGNGCTSSAAATVVQAGLSATITTLAASGCGANGAANVTTTGTGTGPFTFHWNTGAQTPSISNLSPGTYSVTVTNLSTGCTATATGTVGGPTGISMTSVHTNITCGGACNGSATTSVIGGTAPYSYIWSHVATTASVTNLCPGSYAVTVTDAFGCTAANAFAITTPTPMAIATTWTNTTCPGSATGVASVLVAGGISPYTVIWSNGATGFTANDLVEGIYCATVSDANGCTIATCVQIDENGDPFRPSDSYVAPGCDDDCEGFIQLVFVGGTWPYSYQWSNGSTAGVLLDVCEGIYTVTASDANGCTLSETFEVINYDCGGPEITLTSTNPSCGNCNGSIIATVSGGTTPVFFIWNTGADSTSAINNLCAGTYTVTVYDGNGNSGQKSVTLMNTGLQVTATTTVGCSGGCNGTAAATVLGTSSYSFQWSNGATGSSQSNLCPGTYGVVVTNTEGCTGGATAIVNSPVTVSVDNDSICAGECNGTLIANTSGGTPPYSYQWSDGPTNPSRLGTACVGFYSVTVTDAVGCTTSDNALVIMTPFPGNFYYIDANCGLCNGYAVVTSTSSGSYLWSTGETTSSIANLCPGTYSLTANGDNGCGGVINFEIDMAELNIIVSTTASTPACDGTITASATGGTPPFYFVTGTETYFATLNNLCPGNYTVTAVDANGCTAAVTAIVSPTPTLVVTATGNGVCLNNCTGTMTTTVSGGVPPYSFAWSSGQNTNYITNLCSGAFTVTVTDHEGTTTAATGTIHVLNDQVVTVYTQNAQCGLCNGSAVVVTTGGGDGSFTATWSNGAIGETLVGLCPGTYGVTAVTGLGCSASATGIIANDPCRTAERESVFENLYPNPTTGNTTLELYSASDETVVLRLLDVTGKLLQTQTVTVTKGLNTFGIDISGYANGIYMLQRLGGGGTQTLKLTKQ